MRSVIAIGPSESVIGPQLIERLSTQNFAVTVVDTHSGSRKLIDWSLGLNGLTSKRRLQFVVFDASVPGDMDFQTRQSLRKERSGECVAIVNFLTLTFPEINGLPVWIVSGLSTPHPPTSFPVIVMRTSSLLLSKSRLGTDLPPTLMPRDSLITRAHDVDDFISNFSLVNPVRINGGLELCIVPVDPCTLSPEHVNSTTEQIH